MNENSFNENNNDENNIPNFESKNNRNTAISLIEKLNFELNKAVNDYTNLKIDYNNLKNNYDESQSKINTLEIELKNTTSKFSFCEQKLHENIEILFNTEKKLSETTNENIYLKRNNTFLEEQLSKYKSIYTNYKSHSEKEMNMIKTDLDEKQKDKEELLKANRSIKSELNKTIFKCKLLSKENETLKNDNDHLIQILEETNKIIKTSEIKTLSFDNTISQYKKQISDLNLEIEKLKLEIKLQKEYNAKSKEFFTEKITICDQNFETALNEIRKNLHKKVVDKISEYNELKAEFLNAKIERDKYYSDYNTLNQDYEENKEQFQMQYLDMQKQTKEKESELTREIGYLNDKNQALLTDNNNLKSKVNNLENKNKELLQEKNIRDKLEIKNKEINEEVGKIQQEKEDLEKENEELKNKINELIEGK